MPDECMDEVRHRTFHAVMEDDSAVKATLGGTRDDVFRDVFWSGEDRIAVVDMASWSSAEFVNRNGGGTRTAVFEGSIGDGDDFWAFYPFSAYVSAGRDGVTFNFPSVQNYVEDNVEEAALPMVAELEDDGMFHFHNLCGILELNLTGKGNVRRITFKGYDAEGKLIKTGGAATVDVVGGAYEVHMEDNASASVVLECDAEGVALSETVPVSFHIALPAGTYESFNVVVAMTDGAKMKIESSKSLNLIRSERTKTSPKTFVENYYIDLSEDGTSNCYIVSEPDTYAFRMTKGNSDEVVTPVFSVSVLWETFGTLDTPKIGDLIKSVSYQDGYVIFKTADVFREGNALIAAHDAAGTIKWSWHIWLTDAPQEIVYANDAGIMMDRNIGATTEKPDQGDVFTTFGLLYQWGRKDPFLNYYDPEPNTTEVKSTGEWYFERKTNVENSIKYPTTFFMPSRNSDNYWNYHWSSYLTTDRSSNTDSIFQEIFSLWQSDKTIYDPCPPGWRVPDGGHDSIWAKASFPNGIGVYPIENLGMTFGAPYCTPETYYPQSYQRNWSWGSLDSHCHGQYWSCTPSAIAWYGKPYIFSMDGWCDIDLNAYAEYSSNGLPVRCQKE